MISFFSAFCLLLTIGVSTARRDQDNVQNAYSVSVSLEEISNSTDLGVYVQFFHHQDQRIRPSSVSLVMDGVFSFILQFSPAESQVKIGSFVSGPDLNASSAAGFYVYNNYTNSLISTFNLSSVLADNFPNTSRYNPLELWPNHSVNISCSSAEGLEAMLQVKFEGVVDAFGLDVHWPAWKVIVVVAAVKLGVSVLLASIDLCCLPLNRASSWEKFRIFVGNTVWLCFGGLSAGFFYIIAGLILMVTIVLSPFGLKLVRIGVFALFPFGRVIKCDDESESREICSCVGNVIWLVLFGWAIVLVHLISGIVLCILIITFPLGQQHFKLAKIAFMPFGHSVVVRDELVSDPFERAPLKPQQGTGAVGYV
eukprot:TRINITY_DN4516_c0_g1_i1.p1 TRINITY_DN4516_c0_g1~~TRINITY_DN4516_c0_g1_i1.p1  ORF type:complete len:367 (+),score=76.87 TRINITY_DN4516_c0_g1_i1:1029-2129(+)